MIHFNTIVTTAVLLVQVTSSQSNVSTTCSSSSDDAIMILLNSINHTTVHNSNEVSKLTDSISHMTASLEHSKAIQTLVNQSLSDVKVIMNDVQNRIQTLESKLIRVSPHTLSSCKEIKQLWPELPSGHYTVTDIYGQQHHGVYCNMEEVCGSSEGWTRIAHLDMSNTDQDCEQELGSEFGEYIANNKRACGKRNRASGCISKTFHNFNITYSKVCGKVLAYQYWSPDGISSSVNSINSHYIDGVSLTYGNPRQHIWSFMGGFNENNPKCPCSINSHYTTYDFIGNDYFCESGTSQYGKQLFTDDQLWDGQNCDGAESTCCHNEPWFNKLLASEANEDVELRLCGSTSDEDTPLVYYELYVM